MGLTVEIPNEYGFVVLTTVSTFFLNSWHALLVGRHRKAAQVPYPNLYASAEACKTSQEAYSFNCAQRAHGHLLENFTPVVGSMLIAGVSYPITTSVLGLGWIVGRVLFAKGYTSEKLGGNGKGRYKGIFYALFQFGLFGLAGWSGVQMLLA
ncbi:MAG: hypothetical protein M4579_000517 [Chaenotheca gracillima]|nr:MAG: hypothetical protein M4579_000517 [Chaenotheca gracillima]